MGGFWSWQLSVETALKRRSFRTSHLSKNCFFSNFAWNLPSISSILHSYIDSRIFAFKTFLRVIIIEPKKWWWNTFPMSEIPWVQILCYKISKVVKLIRVRLDRHLTGCSTTKPDIRKSIVLTTSDAKHSRQIRTNRHSCVNKAPNRICNVFIDTKWWNSPF